MDLPEYARALRRRWAWVIAPALIILIGAAYLAGTGPRTYQSTATLFYVEPAQTSSTPDIRLNSYVTLATSDRLVAAVREGLHLATPAADLSKHLSAQFVPSTLILVLTATDSTAQGARALAAEASRQLVTLSGSLETSVTGQPPGHLAYADVATTATSNTAAKAAQTITLGALFGLMVGIILALLREATDSRISYPDQLQRLGIPDRKIVQIETGDEALPSGQVAFGFRILRTMLFNGEPANDSTVIVTSCEARDQVPAVAGALAITVARASTSVVLMSTHLRAPRRSAPDWARVEPGLGEVLSKERGLPKVITRGPARDLWLLPAGRILPYPEDTLASSMMTGAVELLKAKYSVVVIDAPPLLPHADAISAAAATGAGVLLVVVEGRTRQRQLRATLRLLESTSTRVLGAVLVHPAFAGSPNNTFSVTADLEMEPIPQADLDAHPIFLPTDTVPPGPAVPVPPPTAADSSTQESPTVTPQTPTTSAAAPSSEAGDPESPDATTRGPKTVPSPTTPRSSSTATSAPSDDRVRAGLIEP